MVKRAEKQGENAKGSDESGVKTVAIDPLEHIFLLSEEIKQEEERLKNLKSERDSMLTCAVNAQMRETDRFKIEEVVKKRREIDVEAFKKRFPKQFREIATVAVGAAERVLGKETVTEVSNFKEYLSFVVVRK